MSTVEMLQNILYFVIIILLPIITKYITNWLNNLNLNTQNVILNSYIEKAQDIVTDVVISVNQTYVDSLKKSGNFTKEAQTIAFNTAKNTAIQLMSEDIKQALETVYGSLDTYLETIIETTVCINKGDET
jgi:hypothetical protein